MRIVLIILSILFSINLFGQEKDTLKQLLDTSKTALKLDSLDLAKKDSIPTKVKETKEERKARKQAEKEREKYYFKDILKDSARLEIEHLSRIAWRRSAFIPGWGQITNGKYAWIKVPIIYGGFVGAYFTFDYWQFYYSEFRSELQYRRANNGEGSDGPLGQVTNEPYLITQKDYGRRNRDLVILATLGWYGLNIVEAYTNSMLKNRWNISDELAFRLSPTLLSSNDFQFSPIPRRPTSMITPGVKLTISIK